MEWTPIDDAPRGDVQFLIYCITAGDIWYTVVTWPHSHKAPSDSEGWIYDDVREFAEIKTPTIKKEST